LSDGRRSSRPRSSGYTTEHFALDAPAIITANLKVRNAHLALPELVRRHRSILAARELANSLGRRLLGSVRAAEKRLIAGG
jgi:hypothetical protein